MALGADEIEAVAVAVAAGLRAETTTVNAVAVKLPIFWSGNPEVWFTQVESCFAIRKVTVQKTQFDHVIQALDNSTADGVQAVIKNHEEAGVVQVCLAWTRKRDYDLGSLLPSLSKGKGSQTHEGTLVQV